MPKTKTKNKNTTENTNGEAMSIESRIFDKLNQKGLPKNFLKFEIKQITENGYRVNGVCSVNEPNMVMSRVTRPISYYVVARENGELIFNPAL